MIYNFVEYLRTEFPAETIYTNERIKIAGQTSIPDRNVLVIEDGGPEQPWTLYVEKSIQILVRDKSIVGCRRLAWDIYKKITSVFGLVLPVANVGGNIYNSIQVAQINGVQQPAGIGSDAEGRPRFTCNYQIIYRR